MHSLPRNLHRTAADPRSRALKRLLCGVHAVAVLGSALVGPSLDLMSAGLIVEGVLDDVSSSFSLLLFFITSKL